MVASNNAGEQYQLSDVTGPDSGFTVSGNTTVTGNYVADYQVTFDASANVKGDSSAPIVTVNAVPYAGSALPFSLWVESGSLVTYSFANPVTSSSARRYSVSLGYREWA